MAEKVGDIDCPMCGERAPVLMDKRNKLYLHCTCGVMKCQTHKGQAMLREKLAAAGTLPPPAPASDPGEKPEVEPAPPESGRDFGPLALAAGLLIGGLTWWTKKRKA